MLRLHNTVKYPGRGIYTAILFLLSTLLAYSSFGQYSFNPASLTDNIVQTDPSFPQFRVVNTLNADMLEDLSTGDLITATAWEGTTIGSINPCGFNVSVTSSASPAIVTLPATALMPDIVVGFDGATYYASVVYEDAGDIYMETYSLSWNPTSVTATSIGGRFLLSAGTGVSRDPNIDLFASGTGAGPFTYDDFMVVWQDTVSITPNVIQTYYVGGDITSGRSMSPVAFWTDVQGSFPDVACVHEPSGANRFYIAFTARASPMGNYELNIINYDYPVTSVLSFNTISSNPVNQQFRPRIEAQTIFDYSSTACDLIYSVVWQDVISPFGGNEIENYNYFNPGNSCGYGVSVNNPSFQTLAPGSSNIRPAVTVGGTFNGSGFAASPGMNNAAVAFYCTEDDPGVSTNQGAFYEYGVTLNGGSMAPGGSSVDMNRINTTALYTNFRVGLVNVPYPAVAITTSTNSGKDLYTTWFEGYNIWGGMIKYKFGGTGTPPAYKQTGIAHHNAAAFKVYPNPATNYLTVEGVKNANYYVMDVTGRKLSSGIVMNDVEKIDVSIYPGGAYLLNIVEGDFVNKVKFVKQ